MADPTTIVGVAVCIAAPVTAAIIKLVPARKKIEGGISREEFDKALDKKQDGAVCKVVQKNVFDKFADLKHDIGSLNGKMDQLLRALAHLNGDA